MKQLPKEYESRMKQLLGEDFENYLNELQNPPVKAFRVNTDKISMEDFLLVNDFSNIIKDRVVIEQVADALDDKYSYNYIRKSVFFEIAFRKHAFVLWKIALQFRRHKKPLY